MDDREAEPAPLRKGTVKRLKEAVELLGGHANPLVADGDHDGARVLRTDQVEAAAIGHGAEAVGREVPDDLLDLPLVRLVPELVIRDLELDGVALVHFRAVSEQQRRVLESPADIESGDRKLSRTGVREKRADRRVEPLGFAQDDVHQLLLLGAERKLLPENLDRPGHRREGVPDLVRDAGRHLSHGGKPLLHEVPRAPPRRLEMRGAQTDVDLRAFWRPVPELEPPGAAALEPLVQRVHEHRRHLEDVG